MGDFRRGFKLSTFNAADKSGAQSMFQRVYTDGFAAVPAASLVPIMELDSSRPATAAAPVAPARCAVGYGCTVRCGFHASDSDDCLLHLHCLPDYRPAARSPAGYVHHDLGMGSVLAGLVISVQYVATLASRPFAGRLSDSMGAKRVVLLGLALCVVSGAFYLLAAMIDAHQPIAAFVTLMIGRLFVGCAESLVGTGSIQWAIGARSAASHRQGDLVERRRDLCRSGSGRAARGRVRPDDRLPRPLGVTVMALRGHRPAARLAPDRRRRGARRAHGDPPRIPARRELRARTGAGLDGLWRDRDPSSRSTMPATTGPARRSR